MATEAQQTRRQIDRSQEMTSLPFSQRSISNTRTVVRTSIGRVLIIATVVMVSVMVASSVEAFTIDGPATSSGQKQNRGHDRIVGRASDWKGTHDRQFLSSSTTRPTKTTTTRLFAATELPDIQSMRIGDIRKELESYGISTKSFLEKKEMIAALEKARAEGKTPINGDVNGDSRATSSSKAGRADRIKEEMAKAQSMKVGDLKKQLQARGVSTKSFFEKSEFVKAYAEAVVDGVSSKSSGTAASDEPYDPEYRDVVMQKMNPADPRMLQGTIIDVTARR